MAKTLQSVGERTMAYEGMIAETITITGHKDEPISAYVARPLGPARSPAWC